MNLDTWTSVLLRVYGFGYVGAVSFILNDSGLNNLIFNSPFLTVHIILKPLTMHLKHIPSRLFEEANNSPLALSSKSGSCASLKDHGSGTSSRAPSSPTDQMLSPVSRRLLSKKSYSTDEGDHKLKKSLSMNLSDISPIPFPAPHLDFIFGTSSKFRKEIINQLGWSYTQMSPDIDGKYFLATIPYLAYITLQKKP